MAYEAEKNRLASIITATVGIPRTRDSDLEREATERAKEARFQTGLEIGDADGPDLIVHPPAAERQSRLGVPSNVPTAELASWNYLFNDPVLAAANGFLNSTPHRQVLDGTLWDYWGIGIYTEMPPGETNELLRRWWFSIWLSDRAIGTAALTQPSETISPTKKVSFATGTHWGYKFTFDGKIMSSKSVTVAATGSSAQASGRGSIPGRSGKWLLIQNGSLAGFWVEEDAYSTYVHPKLT